jgi:polysaccharide biosynthesis/export protein
MKFHMRLGNCLFSCGLIALLFSSCISYNELLYINDSRIPYGNNKDTLYKIAPEQPVGKLPYYGSYPLQQYKVRPQDNLVIHVAAYKDNSTDYFNRDKTGGGSAAFGPAAMYLSSYTVNDSGYIELPLTGKLQVAGLTLGQIKEVIDTRLSTQVTYPQTLVKLANFRVTVLGEVKKPGMEYIYDERVSLFQAIGMAGDLTDYADRTKIKLVREYQGYSEIVYLDITKPETLGTEYYYLHPNDVIYVEPTKPRATEINFRTASLILSAASTTTLVVSLILNNINKN